MECIHELKTLPASMESNFSWCKKCGLLIELEWSLSGATEILWVPETQQKLENVDFVE